MVSSVRATRSALEGLKQRCTLLDQSKGKLKMASNATPNLPSRSFSETERFYAQLGFETAFRDEGWMILERGGIQLEFFPHPELDPLASWFSCCLRLDDIDQFFELFRTVGIAEADAGQPRLHPPSDQEWGGRMGALIDLDGTLLRLIQN